MEQQNMRHRYAHDLSRRDLLKAGLAAGAALSTWSPYRGSALWGETTETPKRGGILRVRGRDPVHFDPHLTRDARTHSAVELPVQQAPALQSRRGRAAGHLYRRARSGRTLGGAG